MVKKSKKTVKKKIVPKKKTTQKTKKVSKKTTKRVKNKGMDYTGAMNKPFIDKRIAIVGILVLLVFGMIDAQQLLNISEGMSAVLSFLGVLIWMFLMGYGINVMNLELKNKKTLPEWKNIPDIFLNGIKCFVLYLSYFAVPIIILGALLYHTRSIILEGPDVLINLVYVFQSNIILLATLSLLSIILAYYVTGAKANFAKNTRLMDGFNFKEINKKVFRWSYLKAMFINIIINFVVGFTFLIIGLVMLLVLNLLQRQILVWNNFIVNTIVFAVYNWFILVFFNTIIARAYKQ